MHVSEFWHFCAIILPCLSLSVAQFVHSINEVVNEWKKKTLRDWARPEIKNAKEHVARETIKHDKSTIYHFLRFVLFWACQTWQKSTVSYEFLVLFYDFSLPTFRPFLLFSEIINAFQSNMFSDSHSCWLEPWKWKKIEWWNFSSLSIYLETR